MNDERVDRARREVDRDFISRGASGMTEGDIERVIERSEEIERKFRSSGRLGRLFEDFKLLMALVRDYWNGSYREIPWWALSAVVFALLYVLAPVDLIPDFIPVVGLIDDAFVVSMCLLMVERELQKYRQWKALADEAGQEPSAEQEGVD
jgi:uncharacterized membrane protein YkvA (DUF1232 family)